MEEMEEMEEDEDEQEESGEKFIYLFKDFSKKF